MPPKSKRRNKTASTASEESSSSSSSVEEPHNTSVHHVNSGSDGDTDERRESREDGAEKETGHKHRRHHHHHHHRDKSKDHEDDHRNADEDDGKEDEEEEGEPRLGQSKDDDKQSKDGQGHPNGHSRRQRGNRGNTGKNDASRKNQPQGQLRRPVSDGNARPGVSFSVSDRIRAEIGAINGERREALKKVMVTEYKKYSAAGAFGDKPADNDHMEQLGYAQGNAHGNAQGNARGRRRPGGGSGRGGQGARPGAPNIAAPGGAPAPAPGGGGGGAPAPAPQGGGSGSSWLANFSFGLGVVNDLINIAGTAGNLELARQENNVSDVDYHVQENGHDKLDEHNNPITTSERKELMKEHKGARMAHAGTLMLGQALGMVNGGIGIYSNFKKTKTHNRRKRRAAKRGAWTSGLNIATNAFKMISTGVSGFGDKNNDNQNGTIDAFNSLASITSLTSAGVGLVGHFVDRGRRQKVIDNATMLADSVGDSDDSKEESERRSRHDRRWYDLPRMPNLPDHHTMDSQNRNAFKAKKYAMRQAARFNKIKKQTGFKGWFGALGALSGLANLVTKFADPEFAQSAGGTLLGSIFGVIGSASGMIERVGSKITDEAIDSSAKKEKLKTINDYLEKKRRRTRQQAGRAFRYHQNRYGENITDNEADRIAIARLGIDLAITDDNIDEETRMQAFSKLNMKRANNIMNSSERDREDMIKALGLDEGATVDEVAAALTGD